MKSIKKGVFLFLSIVIALTAMSQDRKAAEAFNAKAKHIDSVFSKPLIVFASQKFSKSPTGMTFYRWRFEKLSQQMIVGPDTSSLILKLYTATNYKSGDVMGYKEPMGYSDSVHAMLNSDFRSCESPGFWTDEWCRGDIRVIYLWRGGAWQLAGVQTDIENRIGYGIIRGDIEKGILNNWLK